MLIRTRPGTVPAGDARALEAKIVASPRRWEDELHELLVAQFGEERANRLFARFGQAFPAGYREDHAVRAALVDIEMMDALAAPPALAMHLYRPPAAEPGVWRWRLG